MRVLLVTNLFRPVTLGGYERGCAELADQLAADGHEVFVLTTDLTDVPAGAPDAGGLTVFRALRSYRRLDGSFAAGSVRWRIGIERWNLSVVRNRVETLRPDVVMWWNLGGLNASMVELVRRTGTPACGVVNDYWMRWIHMVDPWARLKDRVPGLGPLADALLGMPDSVDYAAAAEWVFVSDYVRGRAIDQVGPLPRTRIVHSGIDLQTFRRRASTPVWSRRLLFVGRVTENKGIDIAIDALERLDEATLTVYGPRDVSLGAEFDAALAARGLSDRVVFEDQLAAADVAERYASHDAVLFPGRWAEPWGKVPLEAMAVGLPVITSATGGSAEYCHHGDNCLVATTAEEFAAAVVRLEAEPDLARRLSDHGPATAARYGVAQANEGRRRVLLELTGEAPAPAGA